MSEQSKGMIRDILYSASCMKKLAEDLKRESHHLVHIAARMQCQELLEAQEGEADGDKKDKEKPGSIREALDRIYEAGGKVWDDIDDPDKYIADMRGCSQESEADGD